MKKLKNLPDRQKFKRTKSGTIYKLIRKDPKRKKAVYTSLDSDYSFERSWELAVFVV